MRSKTCGRAVDLCGKSLINITSLFTGAATKLATLWENLLVLPTLLHSFCTQLSTAYFAKLTSVAALLSTFPTALIIRTVSKEKEFLI